MVILGLGVAHFVRHPDSHLCVLSHPLSLAVFHSLHRGSLMGHALVHGNELHGYSTCLHRADRISAHSHTTLGSLNSCMLRPPLRAAHVFPSHKCEGFGSDRTGTYHPSAYPMLLLGDTPPEITPRPLSIWMPITLPFSHPEVTSTS